MLLTARAPSSDQLSKEAVLLLGGARSRIASETRARLHALLGDDIDWDALLELADYHQVEALLHRSLQETRPERVPPGVSDRLANVFHAVTRNNLVLSHELLRLLRLLEKQGIQGVPFKGPVAAAAVYRDISLRPFTDLDILVREEALLPAREVLVAEGYETCDYLDSTPADFDNRSDSGRENFWYTVWRNPVGKAEGFVRNDTSRYQIAVELHWQLAPNYFAHAVPASIWERLRSVRLLERDVRTFSIEDTLLQLILHGTVHRWQKLRLVCDVAEMLRTDPNIDWKWTLAEAERRGTKRMLLLGVHLADRLLDAPLPDGVRRHVREDAAVGRLADWVTGRLFSREGPTPGRLVRAAIYDLCVRDRIADGVGSCLHHTRMALRTLFSA